MMKPSGFTIPRKPKLDDLKPRRSITASTENKSSESAQHSRHQRPMDEDNGFVVWTGSLHHGDDHVESIDLKSLHRNGVKPSGFSSSLQVHRLFQWTDCQKYPPFAELASIKSASNSLLQNQFVILRNVQPIQNAAYFFLINTFSPMFIKLCNRMKQEEQAGFSIFENGTMLMLISEGTLSIQLGLPSYNGPGAKLHCVFFVQQQKLAGTTGEFYSIDTIPRAPASADKLDGSDGNVLAKLEQYKRTSGLPIVKKTAPKQVDSLFTPNQKLPGGKVPTPYIPTSGYSQPQYNHPSNATQSSSSSSSSANSNGNNDDALHSLIYGPPPPPPPEPKLVLKITPKVPKENWVLERGQKNKLFENAFAAVRARGVEKSTKDDEKQAVERTVSKESVESLDPFASAAAEKPKTASEEAAAKRVIPIPLGNPALTIDPRVVRDPRRFAAQIVAPQPQTETPQSNATSTSSEPAPKNTNKTNILPFLPLPIIKNQQKNDGKDSTKEKKKNEKLTPPPISQIEVSHESAPMEIDEPNDNGNTNDRPYSPSQAMFLSHSPEPLGICVEEENSKVDEEMKEKQNEPEEEDKNITPIASPTNSNFEAFSEGAISNVPAAEATASKEKAQQESYGFGFNYLDSISESNATCGPKDMPYDDPSIAKQQPKDKPTLAQFLKSKEKRKSSAESSNQNPQNELERQQQSQEEDDNNDKDFRQIWASGNSTNGNQGQGGQQQAKKIPAVIGIEGTPRTSTESPISPPIEMPFPNIHQKPSLPSLIHMNVPVPQCPIYNIPPLIRGLGPKRNISSTPNQNRPVHQVRPIFVAQSAAPKSSRNEAPVASGICGVQQHQPQYRVIHLDISPPTFKQHPPNLVYSQHSSIFLTDPRLQKHLPNKSAAAAANQGKNVQPPSSVLIIDPNIKSEILEQNFRKLLDISKRDNVLIKWHASLTQKLGFDSDRAHEFQTLLAAFRECGVVEPMEWHNYCDDPNHNDKGNNHQLICTLNVNRDVQSKPEWAGKEVKLIYMTDNVDFNSNLFQQMKDKIRIVKPKEFVREC